VFDGPKLMNVNIYFRKASIKALKCSSACVTELSETDGGLDNWKRRVTWDINENKRVKIKFNV
jgi:hypothetical protein